MRQKILLSIIIFIILSASKITQATHIIGGEITLNHIENTTFKVNLYLYFDLINGDPTSQDEFVKIGFFDKATNTLLDTVLVPLVATNEIPTESGVCNFIKLRMKKLTYSKNITLSATKYNGVEGFYAASERCCRNAAIINIKNPVDASTVFYSAFSPINSKDSSPEFNTPLKNGFACIGIASSYNFEATDINADSLIYQLNTPLNGHLTIDNPYDWPQPQPYTKVSFIQSISENNMIPGTIPLQINSITGTAFFTGTLPGIYVFSITVKSYKNGVFKSSVTRDFQLSVIACGVENTKPILEAIHPLTNKKYIPSEIVEIDVLQRNCIKLLAIDTSKGQKLTITYNQISFDNPETILPKVYVTKTKTDTAKFDFCIPDCIKSFNNLLQYQFIVSNENNCAKPKYDTLNIKFKKIFPKVIPSTISTNLENNFPIAIVNNKLTFWVKAQNENVTNIQLSGFGNGFELKSRKMNFLSATGKTEVQSQFSYTPECEDLKNKDSEVLFIATSSTCFYIKKDTLKINIQTKDNLINYQIPFINVITPNGDGINDTFQIPNLPLNNCEEVFSFVKVYNRWGMLVYESENRDFSWDAKNTPDGLYFYNLQYTNKNIKSWLEILR